VGGYAPRALEDSVRSRRRSGGVVRPLNFTVRHPMWRRCVFLAVLVALLTAADAPWPNNLGSLLGIMKSQSIDPAPIALSAVGEVQGRKLLLKFHLTNISTQVLWFSNWDLPWGHPDSIKFVALAVDGHAVQPPGIIFDLCCDTYPIFSVSPNHSLDGMYNLNQRLGNAAPADADLAIVWVYPVKTGGFKNREGIVSGVTWIHTPK